MIYRVGGTVLAGGAAATGLGLLTGNSDLTNAGLTSVVAGGALKGISSLLGKKWKLVRFICTGFCTINNVDNKKW